MKKNFKMQINGNDYAVVINSVDDNVAEVEVNGTAYTVNIDQPLKASSSKPKAALTPHASMEPSVKAPTQPVARPVMPAAGQGAIKSPLPGVILDVLVNVGDTVKVGQHIIVLEAMKMENNVNADRDGKVLEIKTQKGATVMEGDDLIVIG